jgi:hypothetical protein
MAASKETTEAIGATTWEVDYSPGATGTMIVRGYDGARAVRASLHFGVTQNANGQPVIAITSDIQGPAKIELQRVSDQQFRVLDNTFGSHPDAARTFNLLLADMKDSGAAKLSLSNFPSPPGGLHVQDDSNPSLWDTLVHAGKALTCPRTGWGTAGACLFGLVGAPAGTAAVCYFTVGLGCIAALSVGGTLAGLGGIGCVNGLTGDCGSN